MKNYLLASQAAKVMNIPASEIARLGQVITPSVPAEGKGHRSLYDFRNLIEMKIVIILSAFNVPQKTIRHFLANLRGSRFQWLDEQGRDGWIVLDTQGRWSAGETLTDAIAAMLPPIDAIVSIDLIPVKQFFRERLPQEAEVIPAEFAKVS